MDRNTAILFTRNGLGDAPPELRRLLVTNFAGLLAREETPPGKLLFYGEGVKLACTGSPVLDALRQLSERGTDLFLCRTCLDYFGLLSKVEAGEIKGMPDILAAIAAASKVVSV
ncbi:MAG TPA: DsrE family protein [Candidatus Deferrimicrobiaceae bacterium]|jgi:sulfur relay (sulfurtransferase) complex TusBCD TusD component (DsrE family)